MDGLPGMHKLIEGEQWEELLERSSRTSS